MNHFIRKNTPYIACENIAQRIKLCCLPSFKIPHYHESMRKHGPEISFQNYYPGKPFFSFESANGLVCRTSSIFFITGFVKGGIKIERSPGTGKWV